MIPEGSITLTSSEECRTDWGRNRWTFCLHGWRKFRSCGQQCNATWGQTSYRILSWWSQRFLSQWRTFPWLKMLYRLHAVAYPLNSIIKSENTSLQPSRFKSIIFSFLQFERINNQQNNPSVWIRGETSHLTCLHSWWQLSCPYFSTIFLFRSCEGRGI